MRGLTRSDAAGNTAIGVVATIVRNRANSSLGFLLPNCTARYIYRLDVTNHGGTAERCLHHCCWISRLLPPHAPVQFVKFVSFRKH